MIVPKGYILFAGSYQPDKEGEIIDLAKKYILDHGLTGDDVKIYKTSDRTIIIKTKRETII